MLEILEPSAFDDLDGGADSDPEKLNALVGVLKNDKMYEVFIREWENATKMRKWFADEKQRFTSLQGKDFDDKLEAICKSVIEKAKLLIKLQPPSYFQTMDPSQDVVGSLTMLQVPSFAHSRSSMQITQHTNEIAEEMRKEWKTNLKNKGSI